MSRTKKSKALADPRAYRRALGLTQGEFWNPLGTTQSGSSRYEHGQSMPMTLKLLLVLVETEKLTRDDLQEAKKIVTATPGK